MRTIEKTVWERSERQKLPIFLTGAPKTGKTELAIASGEAYCGGAVYHSCDDEQVKELAAEDRLAELIPDKRTLAVFDGAERCDDVCFAARTCADMGYRVAVIGREKPKSGFLVQTVYSMHFGEWLSLCGEEALAEKVKECYQMNLRMPARQHAKLSELYAIYEKTGGLPEVGARYLSTRSDAIVEAKRAEYLSACETLLTDGDRTQSERRNKVFVSVPAQLRKSNPKFMYNLLGKGSRASVYEEVVEELAARELVIRCNLYRDLKKEDKSFFKLYAYDNLFSACREGAIAAQLHAKGYQLGYLEGEEKMDFLCFKEGKVIPVAVSCSLYAVRNYAQRYRPEEIVRIRDANFAREGMIKQIPPYAVFCI